MAKNEIKISANVADTIRPTVAGAERHPGLARPAHDRRTHHHAAAARRLPQAGQSAVVGARAARPRGRGAPGDRRLRDAGHQAGVGLLASTTNRASTSASVC